jgi:Na+:H+ antiporter, NhaA family
VPRIVRAEAIGSLLLLGTTIVALLWANSPWQEDYQRVWETPVPLAVATLTLTKSLHFWIDEGLMTLFFLSVGLEIREEFLEGDLRSIRMAALPMAAALGGVVVPALMYLAVNSDPLTRNGWAIPTATDIAFAIAVFSFLGRHAPPGLRALLLAIAVIDDIVAILVIAFFYATGIGVGGLAIAIAGAIAGLLLRNSGARWPILYALPGVAIWAGLLQAGVHPALTGVVLGLLMPANAAHRIGRAISPWVVVVIMPVFALANAGVTLQALTLEPAAAARFASGIVVALIIGKPVGIILVTAICVRLGWCELPRNVDLRSFAVIGLLGGIGFTMSLFVCNLAFDGAYLATAKLAVLFGSTLAAVAGLVAGRALLPANRTGANTSR